MKWLPVLFGILLLAMLSLAAIPPPPPPTPAVPSGGGGMEETVPEEESGSDFFENSLGEEFDNSGSSSPETRFAILEQRITSLEKKGVPFWIIFLVAVNVVLLGLVIYLLLRPSGRSE